MEHDGNFPREEVVHCENDDSKDAHDNSGNEVQVPGPSKLGPQEDQLSMIIGKWERYPWVIYDDDGIREAGKTHQQAHSKHEPCCSPNDEYEECHTEQVESKGNPGGEREIIKILNAALNASNSP